MFRSIIVPAHIIALSLVTAAAPVLAAPPTPYLTQEPMIANWLPPQPAPGDITDAADLAVYFGSRPLAQPGTVSLAAAETDDVLTAVDVGSRFSEAAGGPIKAKYAGRLIALMDKVLQDDTIMLSPLKREVSQGGRMRPYVRFPGQPVCKHDVDDGIWHLADSGSYPSGHATYGWMWGLVLSDILPERSDAIVKKAYDFGQSRLICGFHYPSDLVAGRLAASALFAKLSADPAFRRDIDAARSQVRKAFGLPSAWAPAASATTYRSTHR